MRLKKAQSSEDAGRARARLDDDLVDMGIVTGQRNGVEVSTGRAQARESIAFRIRFDRPLAAELDRVFREQFSDAVRVLSDRSTPVSERVHQGRRACKKIRAVLDLMRRARPKLFARENAWFRDSARELSRIRDMSVIGLTANRLLRRFKGRMAAKRAAAVSRVVRAHQRKAMSDQAHIERTLSVVAERILIAGGRLGDLSARRVRKLRLGEAFVNSYRRARNAARRADRSDRRLHRWRKRSKTYGFQCSLVSPAWPPIFRAQQQELESLGAILGDAHDLVVLDGFLARKARSSLPRETAEFRGLIHERRGELYVKARAVGRLVFLPKPSAMRRVASLCF